MSEAQGKVSMSKHLDYLGGLRAILKAINSDANFKLEKLRPERVAFQSRVAIELLDEIISELAISNGATDQGGGDNE